MPLWHVATDYQRHSFAESSKVIKAIISFSELTRSLPYFQDLSNIEKKLTLTIKFWLSNQRLNIIKK